MHLPLPIRTTSLEYTWAKTHLLLLRLRSSQGLLALHLLNTEQRILLVYYGLSRSKREPPIPKSTPAPGHYTVRDDLLHQSTCTHQSVFNSHSKRETLGNPAKVSESSVQPSLVRLLPKTLPSLLIALLSLSLSLS